MRLVIYYQYEGASNPGRAKDISGLPAKVQARVAAKIAELAAYPNVAGVKALKGSLKGHYRVRLGDYRLVFTTGGGAVTVVAVDDRKDVYS